MPNVQKTCTVCLVAKELSAFNAAKLAKDGRTAACRICLRARAREWASRNQHKVAARSKQFAIEYAKQWRDANIEASRASRRKSTLKWAKKNPEKAKLNSAVYFAIRQKQTPKWLNTLVLKYIYDNCPHGMHVDHIIPLRNEIVSGLHVPWNLSYLTPTDNCSKSNKVVT